MLHRSQPHPRPRDSEQPVVSSFFQKQITLTETNQNDRVNRIAVKVINHLGDEVMKVLYQKPFTFRLLKCSAGISPAGVCRSVSGETPDLHKCL